MGTERTLLFFDPMFGDPKPLDWQVHDLTPLWHCCWLRTQILLAVFTVLDFMDENLIGVVLLPQMMPPVPLLPTRLLPALFPQTLGRSHQTIGGRWQTDIPDICGFVPFEGRDSL